MNLILILLLSSLTLNTYNAEEVRRLDYINQYKDLAIAEMYRSGIPASITLAQALHESNAGASPLAKNANNHFGIKCKTYWKGQTYMHFDDDYNKKGELVQSCFRAYDTVIESYVDRSNFLRSSERYNALFALDKNDYNAWAKGLKECGYATDPRYSDILIRLIKKYNLEEFDKAANPWQVLIEYTNMDQQPVSGQDLKVISD